MSDVVVIPSHEVDYTYLSRSPQGRLFRKHILTMGSLRHPVTGATINVDNAFVSKLKDNFFSGVCDIVQVPLADSQNRHSEDPTRNIGEVVDVQESDGKIYAVIDARNEDMADKLGKTLLGVSAMLSLDYLDTKTNKRVGPTLLHACVTNRPYVTGLDDYQEIVAASADSDSQVVVLTPANQEPVMRTLEELTKELLEEHGVDLSALQTQAGTGAADTAALTAQIVEQLRSSGTLKLSAADQVTADDVVGAVAELAQTNVALTNRVGTLESVAADSEVQRLVDEGRIMPAQKAVMIELRLTNEDTFNRLVPDKPIVAMSREAGVTPPEDEATKANLDAEIARLTASEGPASMYFKTPSK